MNWIQKAVKRKSIKQSQDAIKLVEAAKRNGQIKPEIADGLLKQLKASIEVANETKE